MTLRMNMRAAIPFWASYLERSVLLKRPVTTTTTGWKRTSDSSSNLPQNILLLRHGRSLGNEDEALFSRMPDWKIPLSPKGRKQAQEAGERIRNIIGNAPVLFYVSPYRRTKQTLQEMQPYMNSSNVLFTREEPRLREQDFGNFQDIELIQQAKAERQKFGRFFYRFPHGESGADVFDRVSAFCATLYRDLNQIQRPDATAVFVTHGITARLFVMRWLHWTVEDFEKLHNPPNCGLLHLQRMVTRDGAVAYRLTDESRQLIKSPKEEGIGRALQLGHKLVRGSSASRSNDRILWNSMSETAWGT